jgi:hypothetical protein
VKPSPQLYGGWLAALHPAAWKEAENMARATGHRLKFDIRPAIESLGWEVVLQQVGIDRVVEQVGIDRVLKQFGIERLVEQVGIDRLVEQVGIDRVLEQLGDKEVSKRIGIDRWLATLTPAQRRELKRRLQ